MNAKSASAWLLNGLLVVGILAGLVGTTWMFHASNSMTPARTIVVSGQGRANVAPDLAVLTFSVLTQGKDPKTIQAENVTKMNKAIAFVKEQGIPSKDIQTSNFNLQPNYRYDMELRPGVPTIVDYTVTQTVTLKIRDLEKASPVLAGLPATGVNNIGQLTYTLEDPESQKTIARQAAFDNAWNKAKVLADAAGVRIARVVTFSEDYGGYPVPMYARAESMAKDSAGAPPVPTLEQGQEEVTVNVSVTFEIR